MKTYELPHRVEKLGHDGNGYVACTVIATREWIATEAWHFLGTGGMERHIRDKKTQFDLKYSVPGKRWQTHNIRRVCRWGVTVNSEFICVPNKDTDSNLAYTGFSIHLERLFGVKLYPNKLNIVRFGENKVLDVGITPAVPYDTHPTVLTVAPDALTVAVARGKRVVVIDLE